MISLAAIFLNSLHERLKAILDSQLLFSRFILFEFKGKNSWMAVVFFLNKRMNGNKHVFILFGWEILPLCSKCLLIRYDELTCFLFGTNLLTWFIHCKHICDFVNQGKLCKYYFLSFTDSSPEAQGPLKLEQWFPNCTAHIMVAAEEDTRWG